MVEKGMRTTDYTDDTDNDNFTVFYRFASRVSGMDCVTSFRDHNMASIFPCEHRDIAGRKISRPFAPRYFAEGAILAELADFGGTIQR